MADVTVGTLIGPHLPSAPVSNTPYPTPTWSHLSIQQIVLECLPMVPATKLLF